MRAQEMRRFSRLTLTRDERRVRAAGCERGDEWLNDDALGLGCIGSVAYAQLAAAEGMTHGGAVAGDSVPFVESCCPGRARGVQEQRVAGGRRRCGKEEEEEEERRRRRRRRRLTLHHRMQM